MYIHIHTHIYTDNEIIKVHSEQIPKRWHPMLLPVAMGLPPLLSLTYIHTYTEINMYTSFLLSINLPLPPRKMWPTLFWLGWLSPFSLTGPNPTCARSASSARTYPPSTEIGLGRWWFTAGARWNRVGMVLPNMSCEIYKSQVFFLLFKWK